MIRRPPRATRTDTRFPYTTLFRSGGARVPCFQRAVRRHDVGSLAVVVGANARPMDLRAATRALHPVGGRPCVGEFDLLAAAKRARLHNFAVKNNVDQFAVASFYRLHLSLLPALRRAWVGARRRWRGECVRCGTSMESRRVWEVGVRHCRAMGREGR